MLASDFSLFVERFINGLADGSIYALLALALVVIFRSTGQLNFAQGEIGTMGAFFVSTLTLTGLPVFLSILLALVLGFAIGAGIERVVVRPIEVRNPSSVIVALIGVFLAMNQLPRSSGASTPVRSRACSRTKPTTSSRSSALRFESHDSARSAVLIVVLILLYLLFTKTKIGLAMRAVANNQESSNLVGIRTGFILILGWGLSGSIAVLAAAMLAPSAGLTGSLMLGPFLLASVAAVLGGLDSPVGAVVGGLIVGLVQAFLTGYHPSIGSVELNPTCSSR